MASLGPASQSRSSFQPFSDLRLPSSAALGSPQWPADGRGRRCSPHLSSGSTPSGVTHLDKIPGKSAPFQAAYPCARSCHPPVQTCGPDKPSLDQFDGREVLSSEWSRVHSKPAKIKSNCVQVWGRCMPPPEAVSTLSRGSSPVLCTDSSP